MAREYSQSGRESNGPRAAIDKPGCSGFRWARGRAGGGDKLRLYFAEI